MKFSTGLTACSVADKMFPIAKPWVMLMQVLHKMLHQYHVLHSRFAAASSCCDQAVLGVIIVIYLYC